MTDNRFKNEIFTEWTDSLVVNMNEFDQMMLEKHGPIKLPAELYHEEYCEYIWSLFEKDHVFDNYKDAEDFMNQAFYEAIIDGEIPHIFFHENQYMAVLDESNVPDGWEEVIL